MGQIAIWGGSLLSWALVVLTSYALEQQWPQWRGPHRDGQAPAVKLPSPLPKELEPQWQAEVGLGHSSPIVAGDKIYVLSRRGDNETVACLNLSTGKELWQQAYAAPYQVHPAAASHGKGPKSTPLVADGRLFTLGISGILTCWDARTGKQFWQREFSKQFEKTSPLYGAAMSPVVDADKCIVHVG
ncbi:MAG TPA: PQQ-binding-like beta-propeller repeat protein, partial [Pirellulales bacterium]|nr:PQQ-binding-like beta-propeller repeat protein [Pirellulales bacterium]